MNSEHQSIAAAWQVVHGDSLMVLGALEADSLDACVTDPPYAFPGGFMSVAWDRFEGREDAGFCYWLSGLIDGEGHFAIKAHTRGTHAPSFRIKMRADEEGTLEVIRRVTGIGTITRENRMPNPMTLWTVGDKDGCSRLVDLLDKYPLRAKKRADYFFWRAAVCEWLGRPRGNRWHGAADDTPMKALRTRMMAGRAYDPVAWSGHEYQDWCRLWAREVLRVLKPGAYLVAFGAPRSYHRLACGIEDAGFEIRDGLQWIFGSGFPKSLNVGEGRGTALKPGYEPIVLARKPLVGTVRGNVEAFGTGALNIDACRIGETRAVPASLSTCKTPNAIYGDFGGGDPKELDPNIGRWPANVLFDEAAAVELDDQSGELVSGAYSGERSSDKTRGIYGEFKGTGRRQEDPHEGSSGGASRFFYVAKPSRAERDAGCEHMAHRSAGDVTGGRKEGSAGLKNPRAGTGRTSGAKNFHPCVKPIDVMRWLVRLVTPPGGVVLDPFTGSGTTGIACRYEQRAFVGIEREAEYVALAKSRITAVAPLFDTTADEEPESAAEPGLPLEIDEAAS